MQYPGLTVLDFFAVSGTTSRVCMEEIHHCIGVDKNQTSNEYFSKHLENMKKHLFQNHINLLSPWMNFLLMSSEIIVHRFKLHLNLNYIVVKLSQIYG